MVLGEGAVGAGVDGGVVPVCGAAVGEVWDCSVVAGGEVEMGGGVRVGTGVGTGEVWSLVGAACCAMACG